VRSLIIRLAGFGVVGASGVLPNLATMWLLVSVLHVHYLPAAVVATEVAVGWNFVLTDLVLYRGRRGRTLPARLARFLLLNNADLVIRLPVLAALVTWLRVDQLVANVVTIAAAFALRFLVTDRLIYQDPASAGRPVEVGAISRLESGLHR
jgi:dolichol-phosphate mannosyltransferase